MRAVGLALLLAGCTVVSPDPARDSGPAPDAGEECVREVEPQVLGPHADRVLCPLPAAPPSSVTREDVRAMLAELAELEHRYCEEERARISHLSSEAWTSELEIAQASGLSSASMRVSLGPFGVRALDPLPRQASSACSLEARAFEWIRRHRALWMLDPDEALLVTSAHADTITAEQRWRGLPVAYAGLVLHDGPHGFARLTATLVPSWAMPPSALPSVDANEAIRVVRERGETTGEPVLAVWPEWDARHASARLAWKIGRCVVDASDGSVVTCLAP